MTLDEMSINLHILVCVLLESSVDTHNKVRDCQNHMTIYL